MELKSLRSTSNKKRAAFQNLLIIYKAQLQEGSYTDRHAQEQNGKLIY